MTFEPVIGKRKRGRPKESDPIRDFLKDQETCRAIVQVHERDRLWDAVQAKDIAPEIVEFVTKRTIEGFEPSQIRRQLGICGELSPAWLKIMAALRGGARVEGGMIFKKFMSRSERIATKLDQVIDGMMSRPNGEIKKAAEKKAKEIAALVDSLARLQQAAVKIGFDMGIYSSDQKQGQQGVKIIVQNNIPVPSEKEIEKHRALDAEYKEEDV